MSGATPPSLFLPVVLQDFDMRSLFLPVVLVGVQASTSDLRQGESIVRVEDKLYWIGVLDLASNRKQVLHGF